MLNVSNGETTYHRTHTRPRSHTWAIYLQITHGFFPITFYRAIIFQFEISHSQCSLDWFERHKLVQIRLGISSVLVGCVCVCLFVIGCWNQSSELGEKKNCLNLLFDEMGSFFTQLEPTRSKSVNNGDIYINISNW